MQDIAANLTRVRERVAEACDSVGRTPDAVKLVAVSKLHPVEAVAAAVRAGQSVFGESTVQEALAKISSLRLIDHARDLEWHFVGHLQSNKAKSIPGRFQWLHSLDNLRLALRLAHLAQEQPTRLNALIEVNITGDPKKHGIAPEELPSLLDQLLAADLLTLTLGGLMAVGPYPATEPQLRAAFAALRQLCERSRARHGLADFNELSMGMSGDFEPAIKEGATLVRIGSAIFGERDYPA